MFRERVRLFEQLFIRKVDRQQNAHLFCYNQAFLSQWRKKTHIELFESLKSISLMQLVREL